jgi:hypothetical protein
MANGRGMFLVDAFPRIWNDELRDVDVLWRLGDVGPGCGRGGI